MKIKPAEADRFVAKPGETIRAVLIYGPDSGLIRERMNRLTKSVVEDLADPFRICDLTDQELRQDPARLADEAAAISMLGGRRVIRIRGTGDSVARTFESFLAHPVGDALVIAEAGELGPRSSLRKLFEGATEGAALPCYADDARSLENFIRDTLSREGLRAEPAALDYLMSHLGADRGITRNELEKLVLYMGGAGNDGGAEVSLQDARACIGDNAASSLDDLVDATASGDLAALDTALARARAADVNSVAILNALTRHLQQLHLALARVERGGDRSAAMKSMRPPVHFSRQAAVQRQLQLWSRKRLDRALELALDAEILCKTTGQPDNSVCGQTLLRVAQGARAGRR